jgi:hypothetical protein
VRLTDPADSDDPWTPKGAMGVEAAGRRRFVHSFLVHSTVIAMLRRASAALVGVDDIHPDALATDAVDNLP